MDATSDNLAQQDRFCKSKQIRELASSTVDSTERLYTVPDALKLLKLPELLYQTLHAR